MITIVWGQSITWRTSRLDNQVNLRLSIWTSHNIHNKFILFRWRYFFGLQPRDILLIRLHKIRKRFSLHNINYISVKASKNPKH